MSYMGDSDMVRTLKASTSEGIDPVISMICHPMLGEVIVGDIAKEGTNVDKHLNHDKECMIYDISV